MKHKKVKIEDGLYSRAKSFADQIGYSSLDEFVTHLLEKELSGTDQTGDSADEVENRLRGLGYLG